MVELATLYRTAVPGATLREQEHDGDTTVRPGTGSSKRRMDSTKV
jgi:hypothetical protein